MNSAAETSPEITSNYQVPNRHRYLTIFLIAVVVTALLTGPATVLGLIDPSLSSWVAILVLFLVALESGLTTWWVTKRNRRLNRLAYRTAEVLLIIVVIRIISWWLNGQTLDTSVLKAYLIRPTEILDFYFVIFVLIVFFAWERGMAFTSLFRNLALSPAEIAYYSTPTAERLKSNISTVIPKNRKLLYQDYLRSWLAGGIILVAFVVISTFDVPQAVSNLQSGLGFFGVGRLALLPGMLIGLMVYFLGGLWLASLGRLHVLQARWLLDRSTPDESIVRLWHRRSLLLLLVVALLSASLPIGSTLAISRILSTVALYVSYFIAGIVSILAYILFLISSLFGNESPPAARQPLSLDEFAIEASTSTEQSEFVSLILGSTFWLTVGVIVVLALVFFLRERGVSLSASGSFYNLIRKLMSWLRGLLVSLRENAGRVTSLLVIPGRHQIFGGKSIQNPLSFFRINSLSPRDQIRFFYLAAVKRAGKKGVRRSPSTTADEFSEELIDEWPESELDVRTITEAFQIARYSQEDLKRRDLPPIQEAYQNLRKKLTRK